MYIVYFFRNIIEYFYVKYNQTATIFKRDFNDLSYFEKLFLSLFYRNNIFSKSIANIFTNNHLIKYRQNKHPLVFFFHLYYDRFDYTFNNVKTLAKHYIFFKNSKFFKKTFFFIKSTFFSNYKNKNFNSFLIFLIIQKFLFKRYYNLCSSIYFNNASHNNLVKLNWLFFMFLNNSRSLLKIYDLSKYDDWYQYNFKKNYLKKPFKKIKSKKMKLSFLKTQYDLDRKKYLIKIYKHYNFFLKTFVKNYKNLATSYLKITDDIFQHIKLNKNWLNSLKFFYPVRFSETSLSKYIRLANIENYLFFYIRKNRIFNKGRYSRNRQLYRTGVYWCLWLNIMLVYGLYFLFYRFTFNFGYFWWGLLILIYSTIFSRVLKYNFFNFFYLKSEFINFCKWLGLLSLNVRFYILDILNKLVVDNFILNSSLFKHSYLINRVYNVLLVLLNSIREFFVFKNSGKFVYFWESINYRDESFLRYKTIIHWFTQLYKLLTF